MARKSFKKWWTNDITGRENDKTPGEVLQSFVKLDSLIHAKLPGHCNLLFANYTNQIKQGCLTPGKHGQHADKGLCKA